MKIKLKIYRSSFKKDANGNFLQIYAFHYADQYKYSPEGEYLEYTYEDEIIYEN